MRYRSHAFDSYRIFYYHDKLFDSPTIATVLCFNGSRWVGWISFYPNDELLPRPNISGDRVDLFYHISQFSDIIDMLRQEKPLYISAIEPDRIGETSYSGFIGTAEKEPTGEEEGS